MADHDWDECYRCEHYRSEHDKDGGKCRCIVLNVTSDEECECPGYVKDEPPHLAYEWGHLTSAQKREVIDWASERGGVG